jgi:hypothetical protein
MRNLRKLTDEKRREVEAMFKALWDHIADEDAPDRLKKLIDKLK